MINVRRDTLQRVQGDREAALHEEDESEEDRLISGGTKTRGQTPTNESLDGAALVRELTEAFDELAVLADNAHLMAWRAKPKGAAKYTEAAKQAAKRQRRREKQTQHLVMIMRGEAFPDRQEVAQLDAVVAQLRGRLVDGVHKLSKEATWSQKQRERLETVCVKVDDLVRAAQAEGVHMV